MINKISEITDTYFFKLNRFKLKKTSEELEVPYYLLYFLIYIEDKRFYYHFGIDLIAIIRASIMNIRSGKLQGGSTIIQQLYDIKQEKKGKKRKRTMLRKINQSLFALKYSLQNSKKMILKEYLENVYLGKKYYGIQNAANFYFKKNIIELNKIECFILVERIALPNKVNIKRLENILSRKPIKFILTKYERKQLTKTYLIGGELWLKNNMKKGDSI
ncbi:transglycosylase domain-containing protein [uncultured Cetobacterium sp.]|uniref:transglycosylase domain-containing protein n=1 Tax=uncultured Cetobacterium sp. TaxID=527638 RepID=UPI0025DD8C79|nr:transglycosylase domain-containing protein [uncultured Cetobacterium sp.]